jgi:hypothetical protein
VSRDSTLSLNSLFPGLEERVGVINALCWSDPVTPVTDLSIEIAVAGEFQPCNEAIPKQEL